MNDGGSPPMKWTNTSLATNVFTSRLCSARIFHARLRLASLGLLTFVFAGCVYEPPPIGVPRDEFVGTVAKVIDGDTLEVVHGANTTVLDLHGIDAPELEQNFGKEARDHLTELVNAHRVRVVDLGNDENGRLIGEVDVIDGVYSNNLSAKMLMHGFAWHFDKYGDYGGAAYAESAGRSDKAGLWSDPNPVPPWEWRKSQ